jgi:tripartite-type tricarboxylate transporter receptor subunit TctC
VAGAAPDGATIGLLPTSLTTVRHASPRGVAFDPLADFAPLSLMATTPSVVLVAPGHPAGATHEIPLAGELPNQG